MLKKLSLAALVAMGSMSVASATPLTDAIKGVDLSGFLRIRYYYDNYKNLYGDDQDYSSNRWRTNAKLVFSVPVAENMKMVVRVNAQQDIRDKASDNDGNWGLPNVVSDGTFADSLFYLNYANNGLIVNAGVVPLGVLPFASSDSWSTAHGTGVVAMYNAGNGLTVAGGWVDTLKNVYGTDLRSVLSLAQCYGLGNAISNDVYTAGAIYANDAFGSVQVWDYKATDLIKNAFIVMGDFNFLKDYGVDVKAEYGTSKLDFEGASNHNYYKIALGANVSGVDGEIGYAHTNDKDGVLVTSSDSTLGAIPMALVNNIANMTDVDAWYGKLGYNVDEKTNVYVAYASIDQGKKDDAFARNWDSKELNIGGSYKFNKKMQVSAYYASLDYNDDANNAGSCDDAVTIAFPDQQEIRAEFKYSF
jgi:hypothetical protein